MYPRNIQVLLVCSAIYSLLGNTVVSAETKGSLTPSHLLSLRPQSTSITLNAFTSTARILVDGQFRDGSLRDMSDSSTFISTHPAIADVNERGIVQARSAGQTTIKVTARDNGILHSVQIPVNVIGKKGVVGFASDIIPILTKASCNSGSCHGANAGRGGFHLSLLGYDPLSDYDSLTRFIGARRISPAQPDNSLILRKATARMAHGGGMRFSPDSTEYRTLRTWIVNGAIAPKDAEPKVKSLVVSPGSRSIALGQTQCYRVEAVYNDGTKRDVTSRTLFSSGDGSVLSVTPDGMAKVVGPGEGAVVIRYNGVFTVARLSSPFGRPLRQSTESTTLIDRLVNERLAALGLPASPNCSDGEFIRRATLDVIGSLPTTQAVQSFLQDVTPNKREKLIEMLLASPGYVDFWTLKWGDLLRSSKHSLREKGITAFYTWIRDSVATNKPWDKFVREMLTAEGSTYQNGPVNFLRAGTEPESQPILPAQMLGETTAQLFLGVRLQCAQCHNHPFEKWTQVQYYQLASFFGRLDAKNGKELDEKVVFDNSTGEVRHPRTGEAVHPTPLDGAPVPADFKGDRRKALTDWMTAPDNPFFANVIVNRIWKHYMGRGLVEPVDDFRVTNPATNPPLLNHLASSLRTGKYDLKRLMREIMLSDTYQRSSRTLPNNAADNRYFSHFLVKRLTAEQMLDALNDVTGSQEKFEGYPAGTRAVQLSDTSIASFFLDAFGRPLRQTTCECERSSDTGVTQALHLMNSATVQDKLGAPKGRLATLAQSKRELVELLEELYLSTLSRLPTSEEAVRATEWLGRTTNRQQALEDLTWAILNSKEFLFNH